MGPLPLLNSVELLLEAFIEEYSFLAFLSALLLFLTTVLYVSKLSFLLLEATQSIQPSFQIDIWVKIQSFQKS